MDNIRIFGLSRLDSLDLKKQFPDAEIAFEPGATKDPHHGELATAALVAVSLAGLQALAAWLLKNRKGNRIQKVVEVVKPDGSKRSESIVIEVSESTSSASVVKMLAKMTKFDLSQLGKSFTQ